MEKSKMPGFFSGEDIRKAVGESNEKSGYSRKFEPFKPQNIKMLVDLSDIISEYLDYPEETINKGEICQLVMTPNGKISIGFFGEHGSGKSYADLSTMGEFIEGKHFEFE